MNGYSDEDYAFRLAQTADNLAEQAERRASRITDARTMPDVTAMTIGTARRSDLAIMFVDMEGFSTLVQQNQRDLSVVLASMNVFLGQICSIVQDYGGGYEKNTGDGIMAYFGTETSDSSEMCCEAVGAARWMQYSVTSLVNPHLKAMGLPEVHCRIGIEHGNVLLARLGSRGVNSLVAIGPAANRAFRLQKHAGRNGIAIGAQVFRHLSPPLRRVCSAVQSDLSLAGFIGVAPPSYYRVPPRRKVARGFLP